MTKLHRRLELSVMAMVLKIDLTLFVHIAVHVVSLFIVEKNGPEITTVLKTFSCMFYKSFGIFVTTRPVLMTVSLPKNQPKLRSSWQCL